MKEHGFVPKWSLWLVVFVLTAGSATAAVMTGLNFNMESHVTASGGNSTSPGFRLTGSGGEAAAGDVAASTNYLLHGGFIPTVNAAVLPPPLPTIALTLNAAAYNSTTNNVMTLTATTVPNAPPTVADLYIVLQMPNGQFLSWQVGGVFSAGLVPALSSWTPIAFNGQIFSYTFTGAEAAGTYTWYAAYVTPGLIPTGATIIGSLVIKAFTFGP